jgi:phage gp16-like protein
MAQQKRNQIKKAITPQQVKRIHILIRDLNINDATYRKILDIHYGVTTCKDMDWGQANHVIIILEKMLRINQCESSTKQQAEPIPEPVPERFSELDSRPGKASAAQLRKIEAMWADVSIVADPDARSRALRRFVARISGVDSLRFLDRDMVRKVINALNAMQKTAKIKEKTHGT